ncbi:M14 family metallocarboxypeptidase [Pelagicoccus sp. SDUM812003]|uniref:M14 family metallopeptidase n=1 Tax=Pelagicoccus sp. SDUM812003 TaxID=3041267 RepID=UPI00280E4DB5|nr:M14 family metallocarboxypeptidase [Pelagicoccus sp. SDUM812003]MDQ8202632.1 M14 family metallocarboxypeptidase [Pelagicoccus sp. SDUM812003]
MGSSSRNEPPPSSSPTPFDYGRFSERFDLRARENGFQKTSLLRVDGDDIALWRKPAAAGETDKRVFVSAGVHGDEPAGPLALLSLLESDAFAKDFEWILLPALNPSGLRLGTRENRDGIDLNRDFLRLQSQEIQAFTRWWRRDMPQGCALHFSLHEDWEFSGFYFYAINSSPLRCFAHDLQRQLAQHITLQAKGPIDDHELDAPGLIVHRCEADEPEGWPEAIWISKHHPALSYTFEAPSSQPLEKREAGLAICLKSAIELARSRFGEPR